MTKPAVTLANWHYVPQLRLEIKQASNQRLITVIEILSPANKYGDGHAKYNQQRIQLMEASVHLFEIDLLRRRKRISLAGGELPEADYYVYLSRSTARPFTEIYPMQLREPLPILPVPLFPPDPDVPLDLQAAVNACFDLVGYERLLDYSVAPPPPTLVQEDAMWLEERLQRAGWRQSPKLSS